MKKLKIILTLPVVFIIGILLSKKKVDNMKQLVKFAFLGVFLILFFSVFNCKIEIFNDEDKGIVAGVVTDLNNSPLSDVKVTVSDKTVYSDNKGLFSIDDIDVGQNIVVTFSKSSYASTQKVVNVISNEKVFTYAALSKWDKSEYINPSKENTVSFQNAKVKLPANGIVDENGNDYTGTVNVKASYFDPTSENYNKAFPGNFIGEDKSGQTTSIESYGFINVELKAGDKSLNLASDKSADITIPIPDAFKSNAPDPIPLWYFDEELGIWKEEGSASIVNGAYVGKVSHFSSWNCDIGFPVSILKGKVVCKDGTPIGKALVVAKGFDSSWSNSEQTNSDGSYKIDVKADAVANVFAYKISNTGEIEKRSQTIHTNTAGVGNTKTIADLVIDCDTTNKQYSRLYDVNVNLLVPIAVGETGKIIYHDLNTGAWLPIAAGTTQDLYSIAIPSINNIWISGSNGTVKHITNGIQQVSSVFIGTDAHLYNVEFYNGYYGWIMGTTGKLFRTVDGGDNWTIQISGTVQTLYDASFVSKDEGWICGSKGTILHTVDGGSNWTSQTSTTVEDLKGIKFLNDQKGWAIGDNGKIVRTSDGGQTWTNQNVPGILENLKDIDFGHLKAGTIVGENGTVLKSVDGGEIWTNESVAIKNDLEAVDIDQFGNGVIVGDDNKISIKYEELPASKGWIKQNSNISDTLRAIKAVSGNEAWVVGDKGNVLYTNNAGNNWNQITTGTSIDLHSIEIKGNIIWIGGKDNTLLKSIDYGTNWQSSQINTNGKTVAKIQFLDQNNGFILLKDKSIKNVNEIMKTSDGGANWSYFNLLPGGQTNYYPDFSFIDKNNGYVLNFDDSKQEICIYQTNDAGNSWTTECLENISSESSAIYILNGKYIWITGLFNFYQSEIGKKGYFIVATPVTFGEPKKLEFLDLQIGYASSGVIRKTIDGGKSWFNQGAATGYIDNINCFDMVDENIGWAVGADGAIYYTTTGGE